MMTGSVQALQARVAVVIRVPGQSGLEIEFVLDTGFEGFLSLPAAAVAALGLPFQYRLYATLADGSVVEAPVHTATILWDGEERDVDVLALGKRPLLGTLLLAGQEVAIQFVDGGLVAIEPV